MSRKQKVKISACLVIYNEEEVLDRCLSSIFDVVDEIIVVHDGNCSDKSLYIAKKYDAKIFIRKHVGEAEYHRPFAFSKATGDWIIHIDADEFLGKDEIEKIPQLVGRESLISEYRFRWPIYIPEKQEYINKGPYSKNYRGCLFKKKDLYMLGLTHFQPSTVGKVKKCEDLQMYHESTDRYDFNTLKRKTIKWGKVQAKQMLYADDLPTFGSSKSIKRSINRVSRKSKLFPIYFVYEVFYKILWFVKNGGIFSSIYNYRHLLLELLSISFTYYYILHSLWNSPNTTTTK